MWSNGNPGAACGEPEGTDVARFIRVVAALRMSRMGGKRTLGLDHFTNKKTARMATLEMIDVVHPMAFEWLHPDAAIATKRPIMPIEKLMTRSGRIAAVERAAVAGGALGWAIATKAVEAITATMKDTAATADP